MDVKKAVVLTSATAAGVLGATGAASADTVTIKSGDTLAEIAQTYGTTTDNLAAINKITNPDLIFAGETLETEGTAVAAQQAPVQQVAPVQQQATVSAPVKEETTAVAPAQQAKPVAQATAAPAASGSTYEQFIANGGTPALWDAIVRPESGGNPNAVSSNGYRGLGQTKEAWGTGSVAQQTKGMLNYASSRYGSVENAVAFRQANGWW
ncbi:LysM repeat protein [Weissella uvarum]|uniref:aggregation-promoting factor C-terminal-like domain-containing protein n=1 Tax=Weissella uvarum TaxID=1479233 RepID=UPI00195FF0FC|nr:LysM peptidoglycan-binding domain-containing protein [Weissella uvarum]MBM7617060.1 LysM repeat protein [Weissella uvarum]MCM0595358.1 LysM peptidoglycan-binding domain-containing protein [Weissella uvarum]